MADEGKKVVSSDVRSAAGRGSDDRGSAGSSVGRLFGAEQIRSVPLWVGRDELLADLKADLLAGRKVLALCGQGGIGKTSLAVKLLEACGVLVSAGSLAEVCAFGRVIYVRVSEGMSFDGVMAELARSLEVSLTDGLRPEQMIDFVIKGLQRSRCLVVLDNLEDVLRDGRAIDRYWGRLLWALVEREHRSQVVITSREVPKDLADPWDWSGIPNPVSVRVETIHGIDQVASVKLLKQLGLRDCPADLEWVARRVDGQVHVLTLLAKWARKPGMLRKRPDLVMQDAKPILREQLARQSEGAIDLLKRMCVLRVGIEIEGLTFLRLYQDDEPVRFLPEEIKATQLLLDALVSGSLVQFRYDENCCADFYDLHRVIVEFIKEAYKSQLSGLMKNAYSYYKFSDSIDSPKTLEDLRPLLEVQYFAFQTGNYDEAVNIVIYQLKDYLKRWGHWMLLKDLCQQIIPYAENVEYRSCKQLLGIISRRTGNLDQAEQYFNEALIDSAQRGNKDGISRSLGFLGDLERDRSNWDKAKQYYQSSLAIKKGLGDQRGIARSLGLLGEVEFECGNWDEAERLHQESLSMREKDDDTSAIANSWCSLADIQRAKGDLDVAEKLYKNVLEVREEMGDVFAIGVCWHALGNLQCDRGNFDKAEAFLKKALSQMQGLGMTSCIAETNYDLAKLYRAKDNPTQAQEHYAIAHQIFTQLGAEGELRRLNEEWRGGGKDEV